MHSALGSESVLGWTRNSGESPTELAPHGAASDLPVAHRRGGETGIDEAAHEFAATDGIRRVDGKGKTVAPVAEVAEGPAVGGFIAAGTLLVEERRSRAARLAGVAVGPPVAPTDRVEDCSATARFGYPLTRADTPARARGEHTGRIVRAVPIRRAAGARLVAVSEVRGEGARPDVERLRGRGASGWGVTDRDPVLCSEGWRGQEQEGRQTEQDRLHDSSCRGLRLAACRPPVRLLVVRCRVCARQNQESRKMTL